MMLSLDKYVLRVAFLDANFFNPEGFERGEVSFEVRHAPPASNRAVLVKRATVLTARMLCETGFSPQVSMGTHGNIEMMEPGDDTSACSRHPSPCRIARSLMRERRAKCRNDAQRRTSRSRSSRSRTATTTTSCRGTTRSPASSSSRSGSARPSACTPTTR